MKKLKKMLGLGPSRPRWEQRKAGDRARDARDWLPAAAAYADYLAANAEDWGIWVQRGHCLKEAGDMAGAERSYRRAADLAPQQADPFFQLGSLMKRMERRSLAIDYLMRASALGDRNSLNDLSDLGVAVDRVAHDSPHLLPWITKQTLVRTLLDARAARDLKNWDEAEALYKTYLSSVPNAAQATNELEFVQQSRLGRSP